MNEKNDQKQLLLEVGNMLNGNNSLSFRLWMNEVVTDENVQKTSKLPFPTQFITPVGLVWLVETVVL